MMKLSVSVPHSNLYYTTRLMPVLWVYTNHNPAKSQALRQKKGSKSKKQRHIKYLTVRKEKTISDLHPLYFVQIAFQPMTEPSLISISIFVTFGADMDLTLSEPVLPTWMYGITLSVTKKIKNKKKARTPRISPIGDPPRTHIRAGTLTHSLSLPICTVNPGQKSTSKICKYAQSKRKEKTGKQGPVCWSKWSPMKKV